MSMKPVPSNYTDLMKSVLRQTALAAIVLVVLFGVTPMRAGGFVEATFDIANFNDPLDIDNPYWPLEPGTYIVYHEEADDECIVNDFRVTATVKSGFLGDYSGLTARQVWDQEWLDEDCDGGRDVLLEDTFDWYAQDDTGNIWYLGEETTSYPSGSMAGSWEAGTDGAEAGIVMLASPQSGQFYRQEFREGEAEDMGKVLRLNAPVSIELDDFENCLVIKEWNPLSPGSIEHKYYCPNDGLMLVRELSGGKTVRVEAVEIYD